MTDGTAKDGTGKDETLEERIRRLERQRVGPEDEQRKTPGEAEDRMETAEEEAVPPVERPHPG